MAYSVLTTPEFDARFEEAVKHRMEHYGLRSARKLLYDFKASTERLASTPLIGTVVKSTADIPSDDALRWICLSSYIAVYRVHAADERVVLLGFFHAASNWRRRVT